MSNTIVKITKPYKKISSISTAKALFALTLEVEGYTGPCLQVQETDEGNLKDIYFLNNGKLDIESLLEFCGDESGNIAKWYCQAEYADAIQTDSTKRPRIVNNGALETQNGEPCIVFDNVNDYLEATIPYDDDSAAVSIMALYTKQVEGENDHIIGTNTDQGFRLYSSSGNKFSAWTKRTGTNITGYDDIISSGTTTLLAGIADRTNVKIYADGQLKNTELDEDADFQSSASLIISGGNSISASTGGKYQFLCVHLSDQAENQAEYYNELNSRYNSTLEAYGTEWYSDTPELLSNGIFAKGRLVGNVTFSENIKVFAWANRPQGGFGDIDLVNIDNKINHLVDSGFDAVEIYKYENGSLNQFGKAKIKSISYIEKGRIRISHKSILEKLDVPLPTGVFDSTYPDLENEKKTFVSGNCYLVEPRLLDDSTDTYFIADDLHDVIEVYDQGISVLFNTTSNGFILTNAPVGRILAQVQGFSKTGGYEEHISEHIPRLLSDIDIQFDASGLNSVFAGIASQWSGTEESVIQAINELLDGSNAFMYPDSSGALQFGELSLVGKPNIFLYEREIIGDVIATLDTAQGVSNRLQLDRNYNSYNPDEVAYQATEQNKIQLVKEYRTTSILTGLDPYYQDNNIYMKSQALGGLTNGDIILQSIINLWATKRYFYTFSAARDFDLNNLINFNHSQKGLENGKILIVVGKTKQTNTRKIKYTLWG